MGTETPPNNLTPKELYTFARIALLDSPSLSSSWDVTIAQLRQRATEDLAGANLNLESPVPNNQDEGVVRKLQENEKKRASRILKTLEIFGPEFDSVTVQELKDKAGVE